MKRKRERERQRERGSPFTWKSSRTSSQSDISAVLLQANFPLLPFIPKPNFHLIQCHLNATKLHIFVQKRYPGSDIPVFLGLGSSIPCLWLPQPMLCLPFLGFPVIFIVWIIDSGKELHSFLIPLLTHFACWYFFFLHTEKTLQGEYCCATLALRLPALCGLVEPSVDGLCVAESQTIPSKSSHSAFFVSHKTHFRIS